MRKNDKKQKTIWITPGENKNWKSKSVHRFLKLSKNDQERALLIFEKITNKEAIIKVCTP